MCARSRQIVAVHGYADRCLTLFCVRRCYRVRWRCVRWHPQQQEQHYRKQPNPSHAESCHHCSPLTELVVGCTGSNVPSKGYRTRCRSANNIFYSAPERIEQTCKNAILRPYLEIDVSNVET